MKFHLFSRYSAGFLFVMILEGSCTKDQPANNQQAQQVITTNPHLQSAETDTLSVRDSIWTASNGTFYSALADFTEGKGILSISLSVYGQEKQIYSGQAIDYFSGTLAFGKGILSFNAPYRQLPFHFIDLTIITIE